MLEIFCLAVLINSKDIFWLLKNDKCPHTHELVKRLETFDLEFVLNLERMNLGIQTTYTTNFDSELCVDT